MSSSSGTRTPSLGGDGVLTFLRIRPDAYGLTGFHASGLGFPTAGCYQVTATVGDARLTFVTRIRLAAA